MTCPQHIWGKLSSQAGGIILLYIGPHNSDNLIESSTKHKNSQKLMHIARGQPLSRNLFQLRHAAFLQSKVCTSSSGHPGQGTAMGHGTHRKNAHLAKFLPCWWRKSLEVERKEKDTGEIASSLSSSPSVQFSGSLYCFSLTFLTSPNLFCAYSFFLSVKTA